MRKYGKQRTDPIDRPQDRREPAERVIEIHPQPSPAGDPPRDVRLQIYRRIDPAGFPKLFHRDARDRPGMKHHHIALFADPRRLVLDQEHIRRRAGKGIADELIQSGGHGGWVADRFFHRSKRCDAGREEKNRPDRLLLQNAGEREIDDAVIWWSASAGGGMRELNDSLATTP